MNEEEDIIGDQSLECDNFDGEEIGPCQNIQMSTDEVFPTRGVLSFGGQQSLPALIEEEFDIDGDGTAEFGIRLDTVAARAELIKKKPWVLSADSVITVDKERILRVRLRNLRKSASNHEDLKDCKATAADS